MDRSVSVVINTYQRASSLRATLKSLEQLDYPNFEVVVVNGPSTDTTEDVLSEFSGRIKTDKCHNRNLSESRNLGIRLAAGEIVAFIDDDAYPDPAWLDRLVEAYEDPEVAAAGGPVYNPTGFYIQAWYSFVDRLGNARAVHGPGLDGRGSALSPFTKMVPYTIGTNSSFRRRSLVAIGGFDEEFRYYLDESDVCCRLVDRGHVVRQLDDGFVYHKFLPSSVRDEPAAVKDYYEVLKSKFYFALKHGPSAHSFIEIARDMDSFAKICRDALSDAVDANLVGPDSLHKFDNDVHKASTVAAQAIYEGNGARSRVRPGAWFETTRSSFVPFSPGQTRVGRLNICLLSQEYPPVRVNGIGRVVHALAIGLAEAGHVVHVLTKADAHATVDLEDGVWVHRLPVRPHEPCVSPLVPQHLWDYSSTMLAEVERIDRHRPVDVVQAPNWDSEGIALIENGRFRVVVGLYTPLKTLTRLDPLMGSALAGEDPTIRQMVELERHVYAHADGVLACGPAIVDEVTSEYGEGVISGKVGLVAHGLPDRSAGIEPIGAMDKIDILFVGRLEPRKGADVLLHCVEPLVNQFDNLSFAMVGDDTIPTAQGTIRSDFLKRASARAKNSVIFTGPVRDAELLGRYAGCDIVVVPSRYESFGLMLLEAMMFSKPVVASSVGGMSEIVEDGETGLLVPPDDPQSLTSALAELIASETLRRRLGQRGRQRFLEIYSTEAMVHGATEFYRTVRSAVPSEERRTELPVS